MKMWNYPIRKRISALDTFKISHVYTSHVLIFFFQTIFEAWTSGALSPGYMQKYLTGLAGRLLDIESEHLAPPGWRAVWMR